jgi:ABC-2 type transport system ATP-binding protein
VISVQNLTKSYGGNLAIQSLNFTVNKGEVVGFLGPNGAGKSTTMKIITGFMAPTSGSAVIAGFDVFENPIEVKKRIGYLPETPPVYADMQVREYLKYVAELKGVEKTKINGYIANAIEKTNLGSVEKRMIHNLSKGFRQRVGIAQALVSNPEVLILDEPTVGLDPKQVSEIRDLIQDLKGHHTIILSTHILPEVQATCERIIIINKGQIVAQDSLANLTNARKAHQVIHLKVRSASDSLIEGLKKISGVNRVQAGALPQEIIIETNASDEMIEKIAAHIIENKIGLLGINAVRADLEEVFLNLTYGANP